MASTFSSPEKNSSNYLYHSLNLPQQMPPGILLCRLTHPHHVPQSLEKIFTTCTTSCQLEGQFHEDHKLRDHEAHFALLLP